MPIIKPTSKVDAPLSATYKGRIGTVVSKARKTVMEEKMRM
jgi:hypothetical protein